MSAQTLKELSKLYTQDELIDLINVRRAEKEAEAEASRASQHKHAIEQVKEHLRQAEYHLRAAGDLGSTHGIYFEFVGPKNDTEYFHPNWQSSACYVSDGWYSEGDFGYGYQKRNVSTVEGEPVETLDSSDSRWQSSSNDC